MPFVYFQIQALNNDMIELRARLQKSDLEKDELKMQIHELFHDKDSTQRHLEAISQAHESRITEMHCVIVELNKKLKLQLDTAIMEETEPEGSGELLVVDKVIIAKCNRNQKFQSSASKRVRCTTRRWRTRITTTTRSQTWSRKSRRTS